MKDFLYGLGHSCVVAAIGLDLLLISFALQQVVDIIRESMGCVTIIIL